MPFRAFGLGQGFGITQADGAGDQLQRVHEAHAGLQAALEFKRDHAAELAHLALGQGVLGKAGQAREIHGVGGRVALQQLGYLLRALAMAVHAQRQRLEPAHHQVGVLR